MTRTELFRKRYEGEIGYVAELLIANVVMDNYTWRQAYFLADFLIALRDHKKNPYVKVPRE